MNMAQFTTKKELSKFDIEKVRNFTRIELGKYISNDLPFCYQIDDVIIIGISKVDKIHDWCWRVFDENLHGYDFYLRKAAIFYCIATNTNDSQTAKQIKEVDAQMGRMEADIQLCRYRYKNAVTTNDSWDADLYSNKYSNISAQLDITKKELKKILKQLNTLNRK